MPGSWVLRPISRSQRTGSPRLKPRGWSWEFMLMGRGRGSILPLLLKSPQSMLTVLLLFPTQKPVVIHVPQPLIRRRQRPTSFRRARRWRAGRSHGRYFHGRLDYRFCETIQFRWDFFILWSFPPSKILENFHPPRLSTHENIYKPTETSHSHPVYYRYSNSWMWRIARSRFFLRLRKPLKTGIYVKSLNLRKKKP